MFIGNGHSKSMALIVRVYEFWDPWLLKKWLQTNPLQLELGWSRLIQRWGNYRIGGVILEKAEIVHFKKTILKIGYLIIMAPASSLHS